MSVVRIVGVDPGYRNLAWVRFDYDIETKNVFYMDGAHVDLGNCQKQEDIISRMLLYVMKSRTFEDINFVVIENQMIGPKTRPKIQGVAWLLATVAMLQSPKAKVEFMAARRKYTTFHKKLEDAKDLKVKDRSILLARRLMSDAGVNPIEIFTPTRPKSQWDHLADAVGLVFVKLHEMWGV